MKLYVTLVDTVPWEEMHMTPRRRVVAVELTPEQVATVTPRCVGRVRGKDRYEEIEACVLQEQEAEAMEGGGE